MIMSDVALNSADLHSGRSRSLAAMSPEQRLAQVLDVGGQGLRSPMPVPGGPVRDAAVYE